MSTHVHAHQMYEYESIVEIKQRANDQLPIIVRILDHAPGSTYEEPRYRIKGFMGIDEIALSDTNTSRTIQLEDIVHVLTPHQIQMEYKNIQEQLRNIEPGDIVTFTDTRHWNPHRQQAQCLSCKQDTQGYVYSIHAQTKQNTVLHLHPSQYITHTALQDMNNNTTPSSLVFENNECIPKNNESGMLIKP